MQIKSSIYHKLVYEKRELVLKEIIAAVRDGLPIWKEQASENDETIEAIRLATTGNMQYKMLVKDEIALFLSQSFPQINEDNIDKLIGQYYLSYYDNLFIPEHDLDNEMSVQEKAVYEYFERYKLSRHDTYREKYKRLTNIIFQENYGLGAIDDFADDFENINGIWTNNKDDVYIQFKGLKRKIKGLFFESNISYLNVIKNATAYDAAFDISQSEPIVFCSRRNGSRVTAIMPPVNTTPCLNIRNFDESISTLEDLIKLNTISEKIRDILLLLVKGRPNFSAIGAMGSGKTTFLRALFGIYNSDLSYLTLEASDELRLPKFLKNYDIRAHIYSRKNPPDICLEAAYREDRDIILQGEVRTAQEAYNAIYVKNKVAKGSGDTYHASGFKEYMITRRNLLMETGKYQSYHQAEMDLAYSEDILYIFDYNSATGQRYLKRVSEVFMPTQDSYRERILIDYDIEKKEWFSVETISSNLAERLMLEKNFTLEDYNEINNILLSMKRGS